MRREDASWDREIIQDSLAVIEDEADQLTALIENLLDASRLQAGALSINLSDVDLGGVARRIAERFQAQDNRHTIQVDLPADFPVVLADEDRMAQVLSNLVSNAIKYSPNGGEITICGQVHPRQVVICVSDRVRGLQPEISHIFLTGSTAPPSLPHDQGRRAGIVSGAGGGRSARRAYLGGFEDRRRGPDLFFSAAR